MKKLKKQSKKKTQNSFLKKENARLSTLVRSLEDRLLHYQYLVSFAESLGAIPPTGATSAIEMIECLRTRQSVASLSK